MPTVSYFVDVRHQGLQAYRRISGRVEYVVNQRAAAQMAAWNSKWEKLERQKSRLFGKEQKKEEALRRTREATDAIEAIQKTLLNALNRTHLINWEQLKDRSRFDSPKPALPVKQDYPTEPAIDDMKYAPTLSLLDRVSSSRRRKKQAASRVLFETDSAIWKQAKEAVDRINADAQTQLAFRMGEWRSKQLAFEEAQKATNLAIDGQRAAYLEKMPEVIVDYCEMVLANSEYPDTFPKSWRMDYLAETKLLLVEYSLPDITALPRLKETKFNASRDEFTDVFLTESILEKMYDAALYQIMLRSIHEIFAADVVDAIDSVVINGWVKSIDKSIGQETNACIASIQVSKIEFLNINLAQVDPKACFKKLKGVGSSKLTALTPIRPILQLDTHDVRFVSSHGVIESLDDSINLAAMDWEEFEHLIREVFEKEFNANGAEVKITRASRDGGVDAVVFDPDPLRGGKIVIQAKRYTNTVGVSAVRDLFGTVMNEGANKGILVSTADYGPDAYEFAKDKPLTLLNGANLLHLLEKHGRRARIDLREAKLILQANAK